jgi:16S rRNA (cytosine1402-N4)-methyltransferase
VHQSVLLPEVMATLIPQDDAGLAIDATLGEGGHAEALLSRYPRLSLIGLDADAEILAKAQERLSAFAARIKLVNAWFSSFFSEYAEQAHPDLILMDLGISRYHYEASKRGFSFDRDEPLDMRLDSSLPTTAADIVNTSEQAEIADILFRYGEEGNARSIAARIVRERERSPIESARRLAQIVAASVPQAYRHRRIHPATKTFQALRIAVNSELEQLENGLAEAEKILNRAGGSASSLFIPSKTGS